jgi:hypothetical protein
LQKNQEEEPLKSGDVIGKEDWFSTGPWEFQLSESAASFETSFPRVGWKL